MVITESAAKQLVAPDTPFAEDGFLGAPLTRPVAANQQWTEFPLQNTKSEYRNTKQIQNPNVLMTKTGERGHVVRCPQPANYQFLSFAFRSFAFVSYLVLRISDLQHAHTVRACYRLTLEVGRTRGRRQPVPPATNVTCAIFDLSELR